MILSRVVNTTEPKPGHADKDTKNAIKTFLEGSLGDSRKISPENVEKLGAVAAAHRIYTNSLASLPFKVYRKEGEAHLDVPHYLNRILKVRANRYMSPMVFKKTWMSRAFWYGVSYVYIGRDKHGKVDELIPILAEPQIKVNPADGMRWYDFGIIETDYFGRVINRPLAESELLIHRFESYDGIHGRGMLDLAAEAMSGDLAAQKYGNMFYRNSARPSGIIEVQSELSDELRERARKEFQERYSGENAFRVALFDMGWKYTPIGITQEDAQFIETRSFTVEEISRFSGIPLYKLQAGKQSYQSNEQQDIDFLVSTVTPPLVQMEQEMTYKLFMEEELGEEYYIKANEAAILRATNEARANYYAKLIERGVYNVDEVRALEEKPPLPDGLGQFHWMTKNNAPITPDFAAFNTGGGGAAPNTDEPEGGEKKQ